jgi:hypothetical protein
MLEGASFDGGSSRVCSPGGCSDFRTWLQPELSAMVTSSLLCSADGSKPFGYAVIWSYGKLLP